MRKHGHLPVPHTKPQAHASSSASIPNPHPRSDTVVPWLTNGRSVLAVWEEAPASSGPPRAARARTGLDARQQGGGLVLPATSKFLVDDVIGKGRAELLPTLALAAAGATVVQASPRFRCRKIPQRGAQRAIAEMRKNVNDHVMRLPVRYFGHDADGPAHLAHHERRRGHTEPHRHRPRAVDRRVCRGGLALGSCSGSTGA